MTNENKHETDEQRENKMNKILKLANSLPALVLCTALGTGMLYYGFPMSIRELNSPTSKKLDALYCELGELERADKKFLQSVDSNLPVHTVADVYLVPASDTESYIERAKKRVDLSKRVMELRKNPAYQEEMKEFGTRRNIGLASAFGSALPLSLGLNGFLFKWIYYRTRRQRERR